MEYYKLKINNLFKKKYSLIIVISTLLYSIFFISVGYRLDTISNSELITYKLFFTNPESILGTYNHWIPNFIGAQIVNISGRYSIFTLRVLGIIVIFFISFLLYRILITFFDKFISIVSIFFSLIFILKNYTIFNSSLITGLFYTMFILLIVQAFKNKRDNLFFFAGICLSLNFFTDCQNIVCLLCILGIFFYYKIAKVSNIKQNKQFIPLIGGLFISSAVIIFIMNAFGQLSCYIDSVINSYSNFENSIGIYSDLSIIKSLKVLPSNYAYWSLLIIVLFFLVSKLIYLIKNKYLSILGIVIISVMTSYFIGDDWDSIFIGISFAILIIYIINILKCSNEFRLVCILSFIMETSLCLGILRNNTTLVYGIWLSMSLMFISTIKYIKSNLNISVSSMHDKNIRKLFTISKKESSFVFISLFIVYILCSYKTIYSNFSLFSFNNTSILSNENYIDCQINNKNNLKEFLSLTKCIEKYNNSSNFLLTQNDLNLLYFTTNKAPFLGYTIYDEDSIPINVQLKTNTDKNNSYPIVVIKKALAHDIYYSNVTDFVNSNNYKSVYKSDYAEVFIPSTNSKK